MPWFLFCLSLAFVCNFRGDVHHCFNLIDFTQTLNHSTIRTDNDAIGHYVFVNEFNRQGRQSANESTSGNVISDQMSLFVKAVNSLATDRDDFSNVASAPGRNSTINGHLVEHIIVVDVVDEFTDWNGRLADGNACWQIPHDCAALLTQAVNAAIS